MEIGKYVSIGMNMTHKSGKVSYFHKDCVYCMPIVAGGEPKIVDETPPKDAVCRYCGKKILDKGGCE